MSKYVIDGTTLVGIGDAIRAKGSTTDKILVSDLATAITNLPTGGVDLPEEAYLITGDCGYRFANSGWSWFLREYGDKVTTKDVSNCSRMFFQTDGIDRVPFDINLSSTQANNFSYMFQYNYSLTAVPYLRGNLPVQDDDYRNSSDMNYLFYGSDKLKTIPEDWFETFGGEEFWVARKNYSNNNANMFGDCRMLRKLPRLDNLPCKPRQAFYSLYSNFTRGCYALDEIVDLPVEDAVTYTSNAFSQSFDNCSRINRLKFKTNDDGSAKTASWKAQTIDLTGSVGIVEADYQMINYAGLTRDTKVTDASSYESLKNNEDWWATDVNYSRYNKTSALETIATLPDTSAYLATAGGTNTIKFKGDAGALTDGGAINTLTEEEIAVATAKGWTVTLV